MLFIMTQWLFLCLTIFGTRVPALFSIFFGEYADSEIPQDDSNEFFCSHIGSKCIRTEECCGAACCVLPAWSEFPVCLVPGYKEDEKLERIFDNDPPKREDILYIHNMYNTTLFDFLLSDSTSSPLQVESDGKNLLIGDSAKYDNNSDVVDNGPYIKNNGSDEYITNGNTEYCQENVTSLENISKNSMKFMGLKSQHSLKQSTAPLKPDQDLLEGLQENSNLDSESKPYFNANKTTQELNLRLQTRHKFLMLNSTIKNTSKDKINIIYEKSKSSDQFKIVIKMIHDKLRQLNEKESNRRLNMTLAYGKELSETTETPHTAPKVSKWNMLKKVFMVKRMMDKQKKKPVKDKYLTTHKKVFPYPKSIIEDKKQSDKISSFKPKGRHSSAIDNTAKIEKIMNNLYSNEIVDSNVNNNEFVEHLFDLKNSNEGNDENVIEVYNINIPYSLTEADKNNEIKDEFSNIGSGDMASSISPLLRINEHSKEKLKERVRENLATLFQSYSSKPHNVLEISNNDQNKTMKINKLQDSFYYWPIHSNISANLKKRLKKLFIWRRKKSNTSEKPKYQLLNEHFLLTLNSRNLSEKEKVVDSLPQNSQGGKISSDFYFSSSSSLELGSPDKEDLYNNSYVFMVKKENTNDPKKQTKLDSILNFFHITRVIPCTKDKTPCPESSNEDFSYGKLKMDEFEEVLQHSKEIMLSNDSETLPVEEIIRIPERLMPEALEAMHQNDTEISFESYNDIQDEEIVNSNKSKTTFFFFFK